MTAINDPFQSTDHDTFRDAVVNNPLRAADEIVRLRAQRLALVAALREARPLMSDAEIAWTFDAPGTWGETRLLAAFAEVDSGSSEPPR